MSTIASLISLIDPSAIRPWSQGMQDVHREQIGRQQAQTGLLELARQKQAQAAEAELMRAAQHDPRVQALLFGGSTRAALPTTGGPGAPGAPPGGGSPPGQVTQSPLGGGPAQQIPAYPDASRYANVPPTSGGPIPPDLAGQLTPTVTPPQSTIASLGPQPQGGMPGQPQGQQNPLLEMARRDPRAAMMLQGQMQAQQDRQFKLEEQRLDWTSKKMGYFGQILQGVNSPESYADAVQEIGRVDAQAAARLPQTYSKEALMPYIKQALSVKDSATLQLETLKTQNEMARLGLQGEPAAMVSELRTMGVNPVTATPEQRQQAQKNIQQRELELKMKEGYGTKQAELEANKEFRQTQTVGEVFKNDLPSYYDTRTGRAIPTKMQYKDYAALPQGAVKQVSDDERKQQENVNSAMPRLQILQQHIDAVYGPGGALERMSPADRELLRSPLAIPTQVMDQFAQKYPELATAQKYIEANAESLARALSGVRGAATEEDVNRAKAMLPNLTATLKVWPPGQAGLSLPDTRETALRTMNNLVDTLNGISGSILGNPTFEHPLHRYENPANVPGPGLRAGEGSFRVQPGDVLPPSSNTKPVGPGATPVTPAGPTQGAFGTPPQTRYVPPAPTTQPTPPAPAPASRPAPPTATSTPAQDEAYRQSQGQGTPAAPAPPAARQAPGRQSQAPPAAGQTRVARASTLKVMNLADVAEAVRQTGRSRAEVERRARELGYTVMGSKLPLPTALA